MYTFEDIQKQKAGILKCREEHIKTCSDCDDNFRCTLQMKHIEFEEAQQQEIDRLKYTLIGVIHSVDKWFDEVDESIDEVNRAAQAREIALQAIEYYEEKNEDLGGLIMQMEDALKKAKKAIFYLSGSAESFNGPKIIKDAKQAIDALLGGAEDAGDN